MSEKNKHTQGNLKHLSKDDGDKNNNNNNKNQSYQLEVIIQFNSLFIYVLNSTAKWPITESAQIQTTALKQHMTKQTKTTNKQIIIIIIIIIKQSQVII
jgi:hypothetical protein